jgi:hypothetical protein
VRESDSEKQARHSLRRAIINALPRTRCQTKSINSFGQDGDFWVSKSGGPGSALGERLTGNLAGRQTGTGDWGGATGDGQVIGRFAGPGRRSRARAMGHPPAQDAVAVHKAGTYTLYPSDAGAGILGQGPLRLANPLPGPNCAHCWQRMGKWQVHRRVRGQRLMRSDVRVSGCRRLNGNRQVDQPIAPAARARNSVPR